MALRLLAPLLAAITAKGASSASGAEAVGGALVDRHPGAWLLARQVLEHYPLTDFAFSAGDATGRRFSFEKGNTTMSTQLMTASSSKLPALLAIAGAIADKHLSFDTFAHEVFPWWTADTKDRRSRVTLRQLLSFTSGFFSFDSGGSVPCIDTPSITAEPWKLAADDDRRASYTPEECAKEIYEQAPFEFEPGSTWDYNSFHLQVAGAMAAKASGMTVQQLLHRNLIDRLNLTGTNWGRGENPVLAGDMVTTGDDYDRLLRAHLAYEIFPKAIVDEMERDYIAPPVKVSNSSRTLTALLGHYSMGAYYECTPPKVKPFTDACKRQNIHVDAGLYGYYPLIDRSLGTYMQVVLMKIPASDKDFFVPTMLSMVLRKTVKGLADCALLGTAATGRVGSENGTNACGKASALTDAAAAAGLPLASSIGGVADLDALGALLGEAGAAKKVVRAAAKAAFAELLQSSVGGASGFSSSSTRPLELIREVFGDDEEHEEEARHVLVV